MSIDLLNMSVDQAAPKYLGVCMDGILSFKHHLEEVKAKVLSRVALIRCLADTTWEAHAKTLRIRQAFDFFYCPPDTGLFQHPLLGQAQLVILGGWGVSIQVQKIRIKDFLSCHSKIELFAKYWLASFSHFLCGAKYEWLASYIAKCIIGHPRYIFHHN